MFKEDVGDAIQNAYSENDDVLNLVRAAQIVRCEMFHKKYEFTGTFEKGYEDTCIPQSLMALISMVLEGQAHQLQN